MGILIFEDKIILGHLGYLWVVGLPGYLEAEITVFWAEGYFRSNS